MSLSAWLRAHRLLEADDADPDDDVWDRAWQLLSSRFDEDEAEGIWQQLQKYDPDEVEEWIRELEKGGDAVGGYLTDDMIPYPPGGSERVKFPYGSRLAKQSVPRTLRRLGQDLKRVLDFRIDHLGSAHLNPRVEDEINKTSVAVKNWSTLVRNFAAGQPTRDDLNLICWVAEYFPGTGGRIGPLATAAASLLQGQPVPPFRSPQERYAVTNAELMRQLKAAGPLTRAQVAKLIVKTFGWNRVGRSAYDKVSNLVSAGRLVVDGDGNYVVADEGHRNAEINAKKAKVVDQVRDLARRMRGGQETAGDREPLLSSLSELARMDGGWKRAANWILTVPEMRTILRELSGRLPSMRPNTTSDMYAPHAPDVALLLTLRAFQIANPRTVPGMKSGGYTVF